MLFGPLTSFTVQASGQLTEAAAYRPVIVAYRDGSPVRLSDLGRVVDGVENDKTAAWYNNERSISLAVFKQPGTNTVAVAAPCASCCPTFQKQLPAAASLHILYDRSESIRASVNDVKFTLVLTLFLVVLVIFLFLRNVSATVIPSLALPLSIVGTFAAMYMLGYSLDNLSLMALTLSVGFVVDDAIVMLENIVRHMELGESVQEAALERIPGDRVHDPLDDAVARGGLHPDPLHGRHHRTALSRVRGDDRRRDPGLGLRLAVADADAVQPVPAARGKDARTAGSTTSTEKFLGGMLALLRADAAVGARRASG